MELRELVALFKKERAVFLGIVAVALGAGIVWQSLQRPQYEANHLLNVGRSGAQPTAEYTYDGFYRLQADERFADTVVRWLGSPRVVEDIYQEAGLRAGASERAVFDAGRLSSQVIEVKYRAFEPDHLERLADAMPLVLNRMASTLNIENRESNWFAIVASDPVIRDARIALPVTLAASFAVGVFLAFWIVLWRHYFQNRQSAAGSQQSK